MREELLSWYARNARPLPWRETNDPYAILVSEVMLQQTQVERVVPRWRVWMERWPSVEVLAAASTGEVIAAWQGLGYNRRALNLHRAARHVARHGWPEDLTELPGVGPYTAAPARSRRPARRAAGATSRCAGSPGSRGRSGSGVPPRCGSSPRESSRATRRRWQRWRATASSSCATASPRCRPERLTRRAAAGRRRPRARGPARR